MFQQNLCRMSISEQHFHFHLFCLMTVAQLETMQMAANPQIIDSAILTVLKDTVVCQAAGEVAYNMQPCSLCEPTTESRGLLQGTCAKNLFVSKFMAQKSKIHKYGTRPLAEVLPWKTEDNGL